MQKSSFAQEGATLRGPVYCALVFAVALLGSAIWTRSVWAEDREIFQVGLVLPLTGKAADYGIAIQNCLELAKQDRPELFSQIRFVVEDAGYEPRHAIDGFNKLVDVDKVNLAATWGVSFCKALAPLAESRRAPLVGLCIDPETAAKKSFVLRFMNTSDEFMQKTAEYLDQNGKKKLALLVADHPYLEEMYRALDRHLVKGQSLTIVQRAPNTEMEFRTEILKLQKSDYDAVGVFLFAGQISTFYKQARALGFRKTTFGTNFFESLSELGASEGSMQGAVFANIQVKPEFAARYRQKFGNDSQLAFGAPAYEFALTLADLFGQAPLPIPSSQVLQRISEAGERKGVAAGPYRYMNDSVVGQYFKFPVVMKRIQSSGFEDLE